MNHIDSVKTQLCAVAGLFPLTVRGAVALFCIALALRFFGYGAMDLMVFALGISALAILLSCLFSVVICGLILQRRIQRETGNNPERGPGNGKVFEAGFPNQTGFTLPPVGLLPLVRLQWSWQYPDQIDNRIRIAPDENLEEEITPRLRCLSSHVTRRFEVSDVLGLCRYSWRARRERECYVLPRINTLRNLPLLHSLTAEDGMPRQSGETVGDRMEIALCGREFACATSSGDYAAPGVERAPARAQRWLMASESGLPACGAPATRPRGVARAAPSPAFRRRLQLLPTAPNRPARSEIVAAWVRAPARWSASCAGSLHASWRQPISAALLTASSSDRPGGCRLTVWAAALSRADSRGCATDDWTNPRGFDLDSLFLRPAERRREVQRRFTRGIAVFMPKLGLG